MPPWTYGFNTSTIRPHIVPLPEIVRMVAAAGYGAFEPWMDELDRFVAQGGSLHDLRSCIEDAGITAASAIGFFNWIVDDDAERRQGLEEARRCMEVVAAIGGGMIAAPPMGATEQRDLDLRRAAERYAVLMELGAQFGVKPLLEVWGFSTTLQRLGEAACVALECGRADAGLLLDVYHLHKGGSGFTGLPYLQGGLVPLFHVNDYPASIQPEALTDADRVYPGDGDAPFCDIVAALYSMNFSGTLSLELFNEAYYALPPEQVVREGLRKTQEIVAAATARLQHR
ncbi:MAG: sugar phosphate isomerase/epimerase [Armatimonadetes bacterium]|nr:sugar phosphate isomerase/epimerase [Armatimonadota bacterium]MDE2206395.1 sugar phosphate isomerase/epimerase [Armatimonadota bacterium]